MASIFISYRRDDSAGLAGRLYDRLERHFARRDLFIDIDSIEAGTDFTQALEQTLQTSRVVLVLIGRRWLEIQGVTGSRRLDDPRDFVRLEIEASLARDIRVIPVLLDGATMPTSADLPESLRALSKRQAIELRTSRFGPDCDDLVRSLKSMLEPKRRIVFALLGSAVALGLTVAGIVAVQFSMLPPAWPAKDEQKADRLATEVKPPANARSVPATDTVSARLLPSGRPATDDRKEGQPATGTRSASISDREPAAKRKVVVGTWGGDYARLLTKHIEDPILNAKGFEVVQDQAGDAPRRAKMVAERWLPRGTVDVQGLSAANMYEMNEAGVLETLDYSKIPNAKNLLPTMKYPYGIGHIYSGNVVIYNPKLIRVAPKGFKDWLDPKHGNKIGFIDIQYHSIFVAASMAATGGKDMYNLDKAKEVLMAVKKAGARVYPTNEAFAQAMKNEEIGISAIWKARVVQWQNAGIPCEAVSPVEGIPAYVSGFVIQKNAPNKENAYAYMNAMLEKAPQEAFAVDMGYNGTVTGLNVAPDLQKRIGFTPEEEKQIKDLDYAFLAKNDSAMKEWWDKVFKA